jgi:fibronectin-binding autotransporter adhesin
MRLPAIRARLPGKSTAEAAVTNTFEWKGGNGAFNNAAKWSPKGVPGLNDNADFAKGGTVNGDGGGVFEVAQLSVEATVTFASVNGSYAPDVDATNGLLIEGGYLKLEAGSVLNTSLSGIIVGQPPASAYIDDGGKLLVSSAHLIVNAGGLVVGGNSTGSLTLNDSGVATIATSSPEYAALTLGNSSGSFGTLTVTSKSSLTVTEGGINFGYAGAAKVVVSDGGSITTDQNGDTDAAVGLGATSTGSGNLLIEGAGSTMSIGGGGLNDGFSGKGSITVKAGGNLTVTFPDVGISMGASTGGSGTLTLDAASLTDDGEMFVGDVGTGKYLQEAGATASFGAAVNPTVAPAIALGVEAGSSGTATVTGAGTKLTSIGQIDIGLSGKGVFSVQAGAAVTSGDSTGASSAGLALGLYTGGNGSLTVSGAGSTLTNTGLFVIASDGTASVTISDGGKISTSINPALGVDGADLGAAAKSSGKLTVSSASNFTDLSNLIDGAAGKGVLNAGGGSTVDIAGAMVLGEFAGGNGAATVSGGAELSVGGGLTLGEVAKSTGTITVTGTGSGGAASEVLYGGKLAVGAGGSGTLTIDSGGLVEAGPGGSGVISIGTGASSKGAVTVAGTLDGSSLSMGHSASSPSARATLAIDGGTVDLTGSVKLEDTAAITLSGGTLGAASLNFLGGALSGFGTVNAAVSAPAITASGGTLDITGAITGSSGRLTIDSGSTLQLGKSVGAAIDIDFASSGTVLQLADPTGMKGLIENFAAGNTIDLLGVAFKSFSFNTTNDHLTIKLSSGPSVVLDFVGSYTKSSFAVANVASGVMITHS